MAKQPEKPTKPYVVSDAIKRAREELQKRLNDDVSEEPPKRPEPRKEPIAGKTWPEVRERLKKDLEDEYWRLRAEGQNRMLSRREKELMEEIKKNVGIEE